MCIGCRFHGKAIIERSNGKCETVIRCRRGDCDNWITGSDEKAIVRQDNADLK